jgi:hypothetical protein
MTCPCGNPLRHELQDVCDACAEYDLAYEPPYMGDEPLGTCPLHGDSPSLPFKEERR